MSAGDEARVCRFWQSGQGCRFGDTCRFVHNNNSDAAEVDVVVAVGRGSKGDGGSKGDRGEAGLGKTEQGHKPLVKNLFQQSLNAPKVIKGGTKDTDLATPTKHSIRARAPQGGQDHLNNDQHNGHTHPTHQVLEASGSDAVPGLADDAPPRLDPLDIDTAAPAVRAPGQERIGARPTAGGLIKAGSRKPAAHGAAIVTTSGDGTRAIKTRTSGTTSARPSPNHCHTHPSPGTTTAHDASPVSSPSRPRGYINPDDIMTRYIRRRKLIKRARRGVAERPEPEGPCGIKYTPRTHSLMSSRSPSPDPSDASRTTTGTPSPHRRHLTPRSGHSRRGVATPSTGHIRTGRVRHTESYLASDSGSAHSPLVDVYTAMLEKEVHERGGPAQ